jgi:hypothetical protein
LRLLPNPDVIEPLWSTRNITLGMLRVGVIVTDWQALPAVFPVPPVPPLPTLGTHRPRTLQIELPSQPWVGVQFATQLPLSQKLASHCVSEVQGSLQSAGGSTSVSQLKRTPPVPPLPPLAKGGPSEVSPPQAKTTRPARATSMIETQLRMYELPNTKANYDVILQ